MTIDSLFVKVTTKGKDLIASNPNKDRPPLKDFNDLPECEKQADAQLEIIKEFVQNFQEFQARLNKPEPPPASQRIDIDYLIEILE